MLPIFKTIGSIGRGILKGFPVVNAVFEGIKNRKAEKVKDVVSELSETTLAELKEKGINLAEKPHSNLSILFQVLTALTVLYGLYTKVLDINKVLEILQSLF